MRVLISPLPVPTNQIGSWTNRLTRLQYERGFFDYIISPSNLLPENLPARKWNVRFPAFWRFREWRNRLRFFEYGKRISQILSKVKGSEMIKWVVVDDLGLLYFLHHFLKRKRCRDFSKIIYSHHGFILNIDQHSEIIADKVLFLTKRAYQKTIEIVPVFPSEVAIVGNGVDQSLFYPVPKSVKLLIRKEIGVPVEATVISWLSVNRPKKGLHLFQRIREKLKEKYTDLFFLIIGPEEQGRTEDSILLGKIPNNMVPKYLQCSDFYFFTSLWHEGFPLSLLEALKCGNICLASNLGGIPEVLQEGRLGYLVDEPHLVESWVMTFERAMRERERFADEEWFKTIQSYGNLDEWMNKFIDAVEST